MIDPEKKSDWPLAVCIVAALLAVVYLATHGFPQIMTGLGVILFVVIALSLL